MGKILRRAGFTLAEMLMTVAIIGILSGFGFVAVFTHQKNMKLKEMDEAAKEIFVSSQSYLTAAWANGELEAKERLVEEGTLPEDYFGTANGETGRLSNVNASDRGEDKAIGQMLLPYGAIDETVRTGGSYVVSYDPSSATVTDVFYSEYGDDLLETNTLSDLLSLATSERSARIRAASQNKSEISGKPNYVGHYGGENVDGVNGQDGMTKPSVVVRNEENLWLEITDPNYADFESSVEVTLTGEESGAKATRRLARADEEYDADSPVRMETSDFCKVSTKTNAVSGRTYGTYLLLIDSLTAGADGHFANRFAETDGDAEFIPGEDLTAAISIRSGYARKNAETSTRTFNSLFADSLQRTRNAYGEWTKDELKANLSNARHLQNLSAEVSGFYDDPNVYVGYSGKCPIVAANLTSDVAWDARTDGDLSNFEPFWSELERWADKYAASGSSLMSDWTSDSGISRLDGTLVADRKFSAIKLGASDFEFEGNAYELADFSIAPGSDGKDAGLFGAVGTNSKLEVRNVTLANPSIEVDEGSGASAGALLGRNAGETKIEKCAARVSETARYAAGETDESAYVDVRKDSGDSYSDDALGRAAKTAEEYSKGAFDAEKGTKSDENGRRVAVTSGFAGGLVGASSGKIEIEKSFATVPVAAGVPDATTTNAAGGLLGLATGETTISNCYASGLSKPLTDEEKEEENPNGTPPAEPSAGEGEDDEAVKSDHFSSEIGVAAFGTSSCAGGFVGSYGSTASGTVSKCMSTASAISDSTAGGFVGKAGGTTTTSNCYALGRTFSFSEDAETAKIGTFSAQVGGHEIGCAALDRSGAFPEADEYANENLISVDEVVPETTVDEAKIKALTNEEFADAFKDVEGVDAAGGTRTTAMRIVGEDYPYPTFGTKTGADAKAITGETTTSTAFFYGDWPNPEESAEHLKVSVENEDVLWARIEVPKTTNEFSLVVIGEVSGLGSLETTDGFLQLIFERDADDETKVKVMNADGEFEETSLAKIEVGAESAETDVFEIKLDDPTTEGGRFAAVCKVSESKLIPGENVYVVATSGKRELKEKDSKAMKTALSESLSDDEKPLTENDAEMVAKTNSIFGYGETEEERTTAEKDDDVVEVSARIYSFRHFENLSANVSGIPETTRTEAKQTRDIVWTDSTYSGAEGQIRPYVERMKELNDADEIAIYDVDDEPFARADKIRPATNVRLISYDGQNHEIRNAAVAAQTGTSGTGLFGTFGGSANGGTEQYEVRNLFVRNAESDAKETTSNVGILAGEAYRTNFENVLVFADATYEGKSGFGERPGSRTGVSGGTGGNAGGLVGLARNCNFTGCAAAIETRGAASAGGLVGSATSATFRNCYSGGRTVDGQYGEVRNGETILYNVEATGGTAGGFVGAADSCRAENCYSTSSTGGATAGGFVGEPTGCYVYSCGAYGLVGGTAAGAFSGGNDFRGDGNVYLDDLNADLDGIRGGTDGTRVSAFRLPENPTTSPALRYDSSSNAPTAFPYGKVKEFAVGGTTYGHVGDWQEVKVEEAVFHVDNGNRLTLVCRTTNSEGRVRIAVRGETSGATATAEYPLETLIANGRYRNAAYDDGAVFVYLDDVTTSGSHFAELFPNLTAGENVSIWADWSLANAPLDPETDFAEYAPTWNSARNATLDAMAVEGVNSLFANSDDCGPAVWENGSSTNRYGSPTEAATTAQVANFRHLQNLDPFVSGLETDVTNVVQKCDLRWKKTTTYKNSYVADETTTKPATETVVDGYSFYEDVASRRSDGRSTYGSGGSVLNSRSDAWRTAFSITFANPDDRLPTPYAGACFGIRNDSIAEYDGAGFSILNSEFKNVPTLGAPDITNAESVSANEAYEGAGLFRHVSMEDDMYVHDLTFVNVDVSGHNAGAVAAAAGYVIGVDKDSRGQHALTIENVTVRGDVNVKARRYSAGIVGTCYSNATISNCDVYSPYGVVMDVWHDYTSANQYGASKEAGGGSSGGIIGNMHGVTFKISNSSAAIYVDGYQNDNSGGLIGRMGQMRSLSNDRSYMRNCWVGGHTVNGVYEDTRYARPGARGSWPTGSGNANELRRQKLVAGRNVIGGRNTGGLVGYYMTAASSPTGADFDRCFTTASVGGTMATGLVGGFFAQIQQSSKLVVTDCYAYNRIYYHGSDSSKAGSFVQNSSSGMTAQSRGNFVIPLNEDLKLVATESNEAVSAKIVEKSPLSADVLESGHGSSDSKPYDVYYKGRYYPFLLDDYVVGKTFRGDWERSSELDSYDLPFAFDNEDRLTLEFDVPRDSVGTNAYVTLVLRDVATGKTRYGCMWVRSWDAKPYFLSLSDADKTEIGADEYFADKLPGTSITTESVLEISNYSVDDSHSTIRMILDDMSTASRHFCQLFPSFTVGGDVEAYVSLGYDRTLVSKINDGTFEISDAHKATANKTFRRAVRKNDDGSFSYETYSPVQYEWNDEASLNGKARMTRTNSLFSDETADPAVNPTGSVDRTAGIRSFRHFQNLDNYFSGLDASASTVKYVSAEQLVDIQWGGAANSPMSYLSRIAKATGRDRDSIVLYTKAGAVATRPGMFMGIQSVVLTRYFGKVENGRNPRMHDVSQAKGTGANLTNNHVNYAVPFKEVKGIQLTIENVDSWNLHDMEPEGAVSQRAGAWVGDVWSGGSLIMRNMKISGDDVVAKHSYAGNDGKSSLGLFVCRMNGGSVRLENVTIDAKKLEIESPRATGLFIGVLTNSAVATVVNAKIESPAGSTISVSGGTGGAQVGGILGDANAKAKLIVNGLTVTTDRITVSSGSGTTGNAGGIAGRIYNGTIETTNVDFDSDRLYVNGATGAGGIVGWVEGASSTTNLTTSKSKVYGRFACVEQTNQSSANNAAGGFVGVLTGSYSRLSAVDSSATTYVKGRVAGGFAGRLSCGASATDQINGCYAGGHYKYDADAQRYDCLKVEFNPENPYSTEGGYDVYGQLMAGGFVGSADKISARNSFSACSTAVVKAKQNDSCVGTFVGKGTATVTANDCYSIGQPFATSGTPKGAPQGAGATGTYRNFKALVTEAGTTTNPSGATVFNAASEMVLPTGATKVSAKTWNMPDDEYPYAFETNGWADAKYVGDWILDVRTLEGDFGVLYREKVLHESTGRTESAFRGFLFDDAAGIPNERKSVTRFVADGAKNEFVLDDSYLVVVRDGISADDLTAILPDGTKKPLSEVDFLRESATTATELGIRGYAVYEIDRTSDEVEAFETAEGFRSFGFETTAGDATLYLNPYSRNSISTEPATENAYRVGSAGQLVDLFSLEDSGGRYARGADVVQVLDVDMSKNFDDPTTFETIPTFLGTYAGLNAEVELSGLKVPFAERIEADGAVRNLVVSEATASKFVGTTAGTVEDVRFETSTFSKSPMGEKVEETGTISDVSVSKCRIGSDGIVEENEGTIGTTTISNSTIGGCGFVGKNVGTIRECGVTNANVGEDGFVGTNDGENSLIVECVVATDDDSYEPSTFYEENELARDVRLPASRRGGGYNLVVIGATPGRDPYAETTGTNERRTAGFVGEMKDGTIRNCSTTGKVFGRDASGFATRCEGGTIEKSYAECYVYANGTDGWASGFVYATYPDATLTDCRSGGIVAGRKSGVGFVHAPTPPEDGGEPNLVRCWSVTYVIDVDEKYYPFTDADEVIDEATSRSMYPGCDEIYYMLEFRNANMYGSVLHPSPALKGRIAKTSSALAQVEGLGTTENVVSEIYGQYRNDDDGFPYPMPVKADGTPMTFRGDWNVDSSETDDSHDVVIDLNGGTAGEPAANP